MLQCFVISGLSGRPERKMRPEGPTRTRFWTSAPRVPVAALWLGRRVRLLADWAPRVCFVRWLPLADTRAT
eukprot:3325105-Pyramimonas_sp.AAC.1